MDGASTEMMIVMQEGSTLEEVDRTLEALARIAMGARMGSAGARS